MRQKQPQISDFGKSRIFCKFLFFKFLAQTRKFRHFEPNGINFLIFFNLLTVPYFENADFRCDICFRKFWAQMPKCCHFFTKCINFLMLAKFFLILFRRYWFQMWHSLSTQANSVLTVCNLFGKVYFCKSLKNL